LLKKTHRGGGGSEGSSTIITSYCFGQWLNLLKTQRLKPRELRLHQMLRRSNRDLPGDVVIGLGACVNKGIVAPSFTQELQECMCHAGILFEQEVAVEEICAISNMMQAWHTGLDMGPEWVSP
jgi:hypothetical protein